MKMIARTLGISRNTVRAALASEGSYAGSIPVARSTGPPW
jgi:hypothetical protein